MEHVLHVSSIASVIGRCLNLNTDLINAIAMGHDLGHPAFGHAGERKLDIILTDLGIPGGFKHEIHGLRVVDRLTNYGDGLNLTYEVRDGIITHCGETFERVVQPNRNRNLHDLESITERNCYPSTLEGCLVRMIDRVAYLGRDLEDGMKAGLIEKADIPQPVANDLGTDNGKIIGRFVNDVITNSIGQDRIAMSSETFELMKLLKSFNYKRIYLHPATERRGAKSGKILEQLFFELSSIIEQSERGTAVQFCTGLVREAPLLQVLFHFMKNSNYTDDTPVWRIVTDYIAGMTDTFAQRTYASLFLPTPVV